MNRIFLSVLLFVIAFTPFSVNGHLNQYSITKVSLQDQQLHICLIFDQNDLRHAVISNYPFLKELPYHSQFQDCLEEYCDINFGIEINSNKIKLLRSNTFLGPTQTVIEYRSNSTFHFTDELSIRNTALLKEFKHQKNTILFDVNNTKRRVDLFNKRQHILIKHCNI